MVEEECHRCALTTFVILFLFCSLLCVTLFLSSLHFALHHNPDPGSSLFADTNISYRGFPLFSSLPLGSAIFVPKIKPLHLASLFVCNSQFGSHSTVRR
jgi:hypothetical protein